MRRIVLSPALLVFILSSHANAQIALGQFEFNPALFGDSLQESDGGIFASMNWLNVEEADPGNPGYLTGAGFDTGIANIGAGDTPDDYNLTVGYRMPITNQPGPDFGVVVARFTVDDFNIAVSHDGTAYSDFELVSGDSAVATGTRKKFFYDNTGPFSAFLFVHPIDLDLFGVSLGEFVSSIRISSNDELDLVRIAGLQVVPEPSITVLMAGRLMFLILGDRHRRKFNENHTQRRPHSEFFLQHPTTSPF